MDPNKIKLIVFDRKKEPEKAMLHSSMVYYDLIMMCIETGQKDKVENDFASFKVNLVEIVKGSKYPLYIDWAKSKLLEINAGLIKMLARRVHNSVVCYLPNDVPEEDLIQIGNTSFINAIKTYDSNRGTLGTYAYKIMKNDMIREANAMQFIRKPEWRSKNKEINNNYIYMSTTLDTTVVRGEEGDEKPLLDLQIDNFNPETNYSIEYNQERVKELIDDLKPRDKTIFLMSIGFKEGDENKSKEKKQYTLQEIADECNLTKGRVSQILKEIKTKIIKMLD